MATTQELADRIAHLETAIFGGPNIGGALSQDNLTAKAGGGQLGGPNINFAINRVTTVATAADSVTLPPATGPQLHIIIINAAAVNSMNVFPNTGDKINALSANAAFAVAAGKMVIFTASGTGQWHTVTSA